MHRFENGVHIQNDLGGPASTAPPIHVLLGHLPVVPGAPSSGGLHFERLA